MAILNEYDNLIGLNLNLVNVYASFSLDFRLKQNE